MHALDVAVEAARLREFRFAHRAVVGADVEVLTHMHDHVCAPTMLKLAALGRAEVHRDKFLGVFGVADKSAPVRLLRETSEAACDVRHGRLLAFLDLLLDEVFDRAVASGQCGLAVVRGLCRQLKFNLCALEFHEGLARAVSAMRDGALCEHPYKQEVLFAELLD